MALRFRFLNNVKNYDLVIFDCDGVIFDSNKLKTEAFRHVLDSYPCELVDELVTYHKQNGGVSRYEKFKLFFSKMHPVENKKHATNKSIISFSEYVSKGYLQSSPVEEAISFAEYSFDRCINYVVSGSDEKELNEVFDFHGINSLFKSVLGSPTKKQTHVEKILIKEKVSANNALFIGDGKADFDTARNFYMDFVFLSQMTEWENANDYLGQYNKVFIAPSWGDIHACAL